MKKTFKILAVSLFSITAMTVVSCDNESYDPVIEGEKGVGKRMVTIHNQGDVIMHREGVVASRDRSGGLTIKINAADKTGKDILTLKVFKFQLGSFPTNSPANECNYFSVEQDLKYTTIDEDRPNIVTGAVTISEINRKARVLSGDFDIKRMMPEKNDDPNLKAFPISGSFKDIPIVRDYPTYLEALINNEELENPRESYTIEGGRIVIRSLDNVEKTQELILDLPESKIELGDEEGLKDPRKLGWFNVKYISKYGVKYSSKGMGEDDGVLYIDSVRYDTKGNIKELKGRFDATLVGVDEKDKDNYLKVSFGEFSILF